MDISKATHRVTWRIPNDTKNAIDKIAAKTMFNREEVGNILMKFATDNFEEVKPVIERYTREAELAKRKRESAEKAVAGISTDILEKLAGYSPEQLAMLIAKDEKK